MLMINKNCLPLFKKLKREYIYFVQNGVFLAFDKDTLEYIGVEVFYSASNQVYKICDEKLKQLLALDILELR